MRQTAMSVRFRRDPVGQYGRQTGRLRLNRRQPKSFKQGRHYKNIHDAKHQPRYIRPRAGKANAAGDPEPCGTRQNRRLEWPFADHEQTGFWPEFQHFGVYSQKQIVILRQLEAANVSDNELIRRDSELESGRSAIDRLSESGQIDTAVYDR
jgi:hypothetical protein